MSPDLTNLKVKNSKRRVSKRNSVNANTFSKIFKVDDLKASNHFVNNGSTKEIKSNNGSIKVKDLVG